LPEKKPSLKIPEGIHKSLQEQSPFRKKQQAHTQEQPHAHAHAQTHAQAHTQAHAPTPKKAMQRAHFFLPPDQLAFLDQLANQSGEGVSRSDWLRYAITRLMEANDNGELDS